MTDGVCSGFEPQNYLRDRCKKCFRLKSKHDEQNNNDAGPSSSQTPRRRPASAASSTTNGDGVSKVGTVASVILAKKEKRRSWRDSKPSNPDEGPENDVPDTSDTISVASFKSANSKGLSSAKSLESIASINDTKSMVTAVSGESLDDDNEDDRAITPTESECTNDHLRTKNQLLEEEVTKLKEERDRFTIRRAPHDGKDAAIVETLQEQLLQAESLIQDYRDENTVLKVELREIQAPGQIEKKLKDTETLCDELMVENEALKADVRDLQQEIEEMQDQYREEEIEEFRELQRELEQNAKNCRVLQFKLRKAERQRDQMEAERDHAVVKYNENVNGVDTGLSEFSKQRELESELRIAKEVSVRLHNELESAEEKRCKLEDEVFYYKEKCRELQTQNKWREARNKAEQAAKRHSMELVESSDVPADEVRRELRDVLEREVDLREQLRYSEEDLKRSRNKLRDLEVENEELLQKLLKLSDTMGRSSGKRPPMTRSASEGHDRLQLELSVEELSSKCDSLEKKNVSLTKKMLEMEIDLAKKLQEKSDGGFNLNTELEKDLGRLMATINELEKKNTELSLQLKKQQQNHETNNLKVKSAPNSPVIGKEKALQVELRTEQERRKELETEIADYKSMIVKSDNQKLIAMATKVELLQNQLSLANDRCNALHKKATKENGNDNGTYVDSLKQRCEQLEKQLSEANATHIFTKQPSTQNGNGSATSTDELEQCCIVLASVEAQTNRLCKQMEKIDAAGQKEQRRRSLSAETAASIIAELVKVRSELGSVQQVLDRVKVSNPNVIGVRKTTMDETLSSKDICAFCSDNAKSVDSMKEEVAFYKKKNKELTNQVLQTEDRWSREIEKQTHGFRSTILKLENSLSDTETKLAEQTQLLESTSTQLNEKVRVLEEERLKAKKVQNELDEKQKALLAVEKDQHGMREWEIKYKKLEKLFTQEKDKYDADRSKIKTDTSVLKKRTDEAVADLEKLRVSHTKRENMWGEERLRLEREMMELRSKLGDKKKESADDNLEDGVPVPVQRVSYSSSKLNASDSVSDLKAKLSAYEKRTEDLESRVVDLRISKEELESELMRNRIAFERERDTMLHKVRQDDKVKGVEIDALQQKFASRMNIMENTNKSLHSQLVQARRERDHHREAVCTYERRVEEEQKRVAESVKKLGDAQQRATTAEKRIQELEAEVHRLTVELSFSKDAHKADKKLWAIEKTHYNKSSTPSSLESGDERDRRITEDALKAAESVQKQYAEYQQLYAVEVERLNNRVKELQNDITHKQYEYDKVVRELQEQIKVLEIDQRNLVQAKEMQMNAREVLQADQERLLQIVQQSEIQKLTRKYKIAAVVDQLVVLPDRFKRDHDGVVNAAIHQLNVIRDEDCQNAFTSNDISDFDCSPTTDAISQSSLSIKSTPFMSHVPLASRSNNPSSYSLAAPNRSYSIDSNSAWGHYDNNNISPNRRPSNLPEAPSSRDRVVEYDKDGRLHFVPKSIARSSSYDRYGASTDPNNSLSASAAIQTRSTGTWTEDEPESTRSSTGTNILYKIRREELSKGNSPSVKTIAKAFESMDPRTFKRGLFSIRKSRSVDVTEQNRKSKHNTTNTNTLRPVTPLNRNTTSMSHIELGGGDRPGLHNAPPIGPNQGNLTMPRSGRNPFKNMGAKIVDRVRRSLSRSRRPSEERPDEVDPVGTQILPPFPTSPPPPRPPQYEAQKQEATPAAPVKTKKVVKKKVKN